MVMPVGERHFAGADGLVLALEVCFESATHQDCHRRHMDRQRSRAVFARNDQPPFNSLR